MNNKQTQGDRSGLLQQNIAIGTAGCIELYKHRDATPSVHHEISRYYRRKKDLKTYFPLVNANDPRCILTPKSSLQLTFALEHKSFGLRIYAYTVRIERFQVEKIVKFRAHLHQPLQAAT